jgi:hypothetical protein
VASVIIFWLFFPWRRRLCASWPWYIARADASTPHSLALEEGACIAIAVTEVVVGRVNRPSIVCHTRGSLPLPEPSCFGNLLAHLQVLAAVTPSTGSPVESYVPWGV